MKLLVALWALAGTASGLLPVIVPPNNDANSTQWGPVTADIEVFFFSPRDRRSDGG